jgi:hypothetical protein
LYVRRITLELRSDTSISVITDRLDETTFPAEAMLSTYRGRWGAEKVFHQITDVFSLKHLIGTKPKAALFQLSFGLLLYNALQVIHAHLASHQKCPVETISNEKLFYDVRRQMVSVDELLGAERLPRLLVAMPIAAALRG